MNFFQQFLISTPLPYLIFTLLLQGCGGNMGSNSPSSPQYNSSMPSTTIPENESEFQPLPTDQLATEEKYFYFSYDDASSTAGVELVKYHLDNSLYPNASWARPYEFLNFESFDQSGQQESELFNVAMGLWSHPAVDDSNQTIYQFGAHLSSPVISKSERDNVVLTLLIDVSGSMSAQYINEPLYPNSSIQTRLDLVKYGLEQLHSKSLKEGDVINIIEFSDNSKILLENWTYSPSDSLYSNTISSMRTASSTNLNAGIDEAYQVARRTFDSNKINRVIILTDAYANQGEVDPNKISKHTQINELEGIHFSGIGIGSDFQEAFLNELTEAGKGAYFATITPNDIRKAFDSRFIALLTVAAHDVRFRLDFPQQLSHISSAAEESSTNKNDVQPTNFSYNTSQFFLEGFRVNDHETLNDAMFKLTIEYKDSLGNEKSEIIEIPVSTLLTQESENIKDALVITSLASLVAGTIQCSDFYKIQSEQLNNFTSDIAEEYYQLAQSYCDLNSDYALE